jgi:hypothetical protein
MTSSRHQRKRLAVAVGPCVLGLLLVPLSQHPALASAELHPPAHTAQVNLGLDQTTATRVLAELSGASQESDSEKPKSMESQNKPEPAPGSASAVKKEAAPEDPFAFLKDWPFWVIVGGVAIAAGGTYMLLRNSNQKPACDMSRFNAGCFGS